MCLVADAVGPPAGARCETASRAYPVFSVADNPKSQAIEVKGGAFRTVSLSVKVTDEAE